MINLLLIYRQDVRSAYAGMWITWARFWGFLPRGATHCTNVIKSTLLSHAKFHPKHGFITRTFLLQ